MNYLKILLISTLLIGCKEKTFADKISLVFPKNTEMKIQGFNEDMDEGGQDLIYIGKENPEIEVRYFSDIIYNLEPFQKLTERNAERIKKSKDSINSFMKTFFRSEELKTFDGKKEYVIDSLTDSNFDIISDDFPYDLLSNKNLEFIVKEKDTIPLYKKVMGKTEVKTYKAFPIFIKNISKEILKIPTNSDVSFYFENNEKKNQFLRNSNYMICGMGEQVRYFELKPNEILIYAYPFFKKGTEQKAKIKFYNTSSKEFEISIDDKIIYSQRDKWYE